MRTLFLVGMTTGMRLEDCALLEWGEVDLAVGVIRHRPYKTMNTSGASVTVGIVPAFRTELEALRAAMSDESSHEKYVLPKCARLYKGCSLSHRIRHIFDKCGIETTRVLDADRNEIDKDSAYDGVRHHVTLAGFHSLRHTWVSLQAMAGTPQAVIMKTVGHSTSAMTEHYTHISEQAAIAAGETLGRSLDFICGHDDDVQRLREKIRRLADTASPDEVREALKRFPDLG